MMAPMYCDVAGQLQGEAILARLDTEPIGNRSRVPRIRSSQMVVMFWDGCEIGGGGANVRPAAEFVSRVRDLL